MTKGLFITFEGNDGSGKTTISTAVYEKMKALGYPVIYTREPGGIEIAEEIRNIILDPKNTDMDYKTEALLYAASRRQHLVEKVIPALEKGYIVLCDRFLDSSLAYQGHARGLGIDEVYELNQFAIDGHMPDATIFLQLSAEEGLKRIEDRQNKDRLDSEGLAFHYAVSEGYAQVLERYKERMLVIDAGQPVEKVLHQAFCLVLDQVKLHENR